MAPATQFVHPAPQGDALRGALSEVTSSVPIANLSETQTSCGKGEVNSVRQSPDQLLIKLLHIPAVPSILPIPNAFAKGQERVVGGVPVGMNTGNSATLPPIRALVTAQHAQPDPHIYASPIESNNNTSPILFPLNLPATPGVLPREPAAHILAAPDLNPQPVQPKALSPLPQRARQSRKPFRGTREKSCITFSDCHRLFHLPVETAAKQLGVSRPTIARVMRANGFKRWPYRALKAGRFPPSSDTAVRTTIAHRGSTTTTNARSTTLTPNAPAFAPPRVSEPSHTSVHGGNTDKAANIQSTLAYPTGVLPKPATSATSSNELIPGAFQHKSIPPGVPATTLGARIVPNSIPAVPGEQLPPEKYATPVDRMAAVPQTRHLEIVHLTNHSFPRSRKTISPPANKQPASNPTSVSLSDCQRLFHLPMKTPSEKLGVSSPVITKILLTHGIKRWPFRVRKDRKLNIDPRRPTLRLASPHEKFTSPTANTEPNRLPLRKRLLFRASSGPYLNSSLNKWGKSSAQLETRNRAALAQERDVSTGLPTVRKDENQVEPPTDMHFKNNSIDNATCKTRLQACGVLPVPEANGLPMRT